MKHFTPIALHDAKKILQRNYSWLMGMLESISTVELSHDGIYGHDFNKRWRNGENVKATPIEHTLKTYSFHPIESRRHIRNQFILRTQRIWYVDIIRSLIQSELGSLGRPKCLDFLQQATSSV